MIFVEIAYLLSEDKDTYHIDINKATTYNLYKYILSENKTC